MKLKKSFTALFVSFLIINGSTFAITEEERQMEIKKQTDAKINQSDEGLVSITHADGTISRDLQGRFQNFSKVVIDKNGKKHSICNMHPEIEHLSHNTDGSPKQIKLKAEPR